VVTSRGLIVAAAAVALLILGVAYGVEEFILLTLSAVVLLAVCSISLWRRSRVARVALRVVVRVPVAEVNAAQPAVVALVVTNVGRRRLPPLRVEPPGRHWSVSHPGLAEGRLRRATGGGAAGDARLDAPRDARARRRTRRSLATSLRVPDLRTGTDAVLDIPVPTTRRGVLTLSRVGVWCEDPFRLFTRRVALSPPGHVIVYPAADAGPDAPALPGPRRAERARRAEQVVGTARHSGDELSGLRPYAPGDRLTRLHWPALARSGELIVREFMESEAGSLTLLVDLRPAAHTGDSIEQAISRVAGLGLRALRRGVTVDLCTSTGDRVEIAPDAAGSRTLLRALALLGPANAPPSTAVRWSGAPRGGAVWATGDLGGTDVVLVTTGAGAAAGALPDALGWRAETVLV